MSWIKFTDPAGGWINTNQIIFIKRGEAEGSDKTLEFVLVNGYRLIVSEKYEADTYEKLLRWVNKTINFLSEVELESPLKWGGGGLE